MKKALFNKAFLRFMEIKMKLFLLVLEQRKS